jgi:uncharacterized protein (TIGR02588 family)
MARAATPAKNRPAKNRDAKSQPARAAALAPSPWEWVVAAIGAVLVLGALGYLVYFAQTTPLGLPLITLEQGVVTQRGDGYLVAVTITNEGGATAAAVGIEGSLSRGGVEVETAATTLDYVPRFSTRQAGLLFSSDPRDGTLELRALGYAEP